MTFIKVLAENYAHTLPYAEAGLSIYIEHNNHKILFDTGLSGTCVINNSKECNLNLKEVDTIVISHGHNDHAQGLQNLIKQIDNCTIFARNEIFEKKFSKGYRRKIFSGISYKALDIKNETIKLTTISDTTEIYDDIFLITNVPKTNKYETIPKRFILENNSSDQFIDETSLAINTSDGVILIVGCAHNGIVNIVSHTKKILNKKVKAIIGGTHLKDAKDEHFDFVVNFLKEQDLELIAPGHCTGLDKINKLKDIFFDITTPSFCGQEYKL